jgi:hypothetical protein
MFSHASGNAFFSCDVYTCFFGDNNSIECGDCGQANGKISIPIGRWITFRLGVDRSFYLNLHRIDDVAKAVGKNGENAACFTHTVTATTSTYSMVPTGSH